MSDKPQIPIPPAQKWLDFRVQWLPPIVCGLALLAAAYLWNHDVYPTALVARVEAVRADVAMPQAGVVTRLFVTRFQRVRAGDPIAEVAPADYKVVQASLGVLQAEIDLLRAGVNPAVPVQRAAIDFGRIRLDWLRQRVVLATTRTELQLAETQLLRMGELWKEQLIADAELDVCRTRRDALKVSLAEHTRLTEEMERDLRAIHPSLEPGNDGDSQLQAAIAVAERKLKLAETQLAPRLLTAPMDGAVSGISKWSGEAVAPADPIVTIGSVEPERAIGYLRQPFYVTPTTNMLVQVRTRGFQRTAGLGQVLAVGGQLLPINDVLLPPTKYSTTEEGLPLIVSLPPEIRGRVRPGEFVDLVLLPGQTGPSPPPVESRAQPADKQDKQVVSATLSARR